MREIRIEVEEVKNFAAVPIGTAQRLFKLTINGAVVTEHGSPAWILNYLTKRYVLRIVAKLLLRRAKTAGSARALSWSRRAEEKEEP